MESGKKCHLFFFCPKDKLCTCPPDLSNTHMCVCLKKTIYGKCSNLSMQTTIYDFLHKILFYSCSQQYFSSLFHINISVAFCVLIGCLNEKFVDFHIVLIIFWAIPNNEPQDGSELN